MRSIVRETGQRIPFEAELLKARAALNYGPEILKRCNQVVRQGQAMCREELLDAFEVVQRVLAQIDDRAAVKWLGQEINPGHETLHCRQFLLVKEVRSLPEN